VIKHWRLRYQKVLIVFIVYTPENSGLVFVREVGLEWVGDYINAFSTSPRPPRYGINNLLDIMEARGEDIPQLVADQEDSDQLVFGLTGNDLLATYRKSPFGLDNSRPPRAIATLDLKGKGPYATSIFGLPTLCLISRDGIAPQEFLEEARYDNEESIGWDGVRKGPFQYRMNDLTGKTVLIPERYEDLIKKLVGRRRYDGAEGIDWRLQTRSVDTTLAVDESIDYAVDIVLSGRTLQETGLGILDVLYQSDGVLLGNKVALETVQASEKAKRKAADRARVETYDRLTTPLERMMDSYDGKVSALEDRSGPGGTQWSH
jgi:hypothetical protein